MRLRFRFEQTVRAEKDVVVSFFHDVANILCVTPAFPPVALHAPSGTRVQPGLSFTVLMNLWVTRFSWHTSIESLQPDGSFTDMFRGDLFREWRHTHRFSDTGTGTSINDAIACRPVWWFAPFAWLFVRGLFVYRQARVSSLFT